MNHILRTITMALTATSIASFAIAVDYPGPLPSSAKASVKNNIASLENGVIRVSWKTAQGTLLPESVTNKLTGERWMQHGAQLFRLSLQAPPTQKETGRIRVSIQLKSKQWQVFAHREGQSPSLVAAFPQSKFVGSPEAIRVGKLNLKAQPLDHTDLGEKGECRIGLLSLKTKKDAHLPLLERDWQTEQPEGSNAAISLSKDWFNIQAKAHQGLAAKHAVPQGLTEIACTIDKGSDQGMSWGPSIALIWPNNEFLLVGVREGHQGVLNVTTKAGEQILAIPTDIYPAFKNDDQGYRLIGQVTAQTLSAQPKGVRVADRIKGKALEALLENPKTGLRVRWRAELRDDSNYVRQTFTLVSNSPVPLYGVELLDARIPGLQPEGTCPGSPAIGHGLFMGVEMPGARNFIEDSGVRVGFSSKLTITPDQSYSFASVIGISPQGQMRRSFLYYIEREKARPSAPFLHYNCWYDLGFSVDETSLLNVVRQFDQELVKKRGVPVESYLVDDGWDSPEKGLWIENKEKFPSGFSGLKSKMKALGANLAIWISPLGGYGGANERTDQARKLNLIPQNGELDLAQPAYKAWFQQRCTQLMKEAGVNAFKWDRAGDGVTPHFMALLDIAHNLRKVNPKVFINVTVGTWPSPFWLNHVDSTWRMGSADVGWAGVGDDREQWITFRDGYCHRLFVQQAPLYPLNAVMHHGIVHGRCFQGEKVGKSGTHLKNEVRSYFGTGALLQELYLTPSMMTPEAWDQVAESAKWAHSQAKTLVDSHWIGGDPLKLEPYGYAAWSKDGATLTLRNPSNKDQTIELDAQIVFELPQTAEKKLSLKAAYSDQRVRSLDLSAGRKVRLTLKPFEVLVFNRYKERAHSETE